jgi:hypothetical protein
MVGPENQLASLIPAMFVLRLVSVRLQEVLPCCIPARSDHPTGRVLKVKSVYQRSISAI